MSSNLSPGGYVRQGQRTNAPPRSVNVQVAVRCRPLNDRERSHGERSILICDEGRKEVQFSAPGALRKNSPAPHSTTNITTGKKTFTYDQVYGPNATQEDVYEGLVEPIVDEVLQGYNCTVFAYGQTGTGKTHTMEGRRDDNMHGIVERRLATNAGIIPRAVKQVFDHLRNLTDEHSVRVSHLELYNEQLTDLLGPAELANESLRVYEDSQKGTFVQGLEDVVVTSEDEIFAVLDRSATKRKTAETLMNKYSSRSHSIFSITIHIKESTPEGADLLKVGKLNLVDLAGSENVGRSGAVKGRAREAGNINQSLLTLGRVITALVDRHPHIPYRDSKLTRLLQESLGGRNKTCVIATITPASSSFEETASTLDYAHRAKSIKNRPTVNQMIAKHVLLKEYTEEISKLKRELDATRAKNGVYLPPEEFQKLQLIGSQQRDTISQLSAQGEDYERKLALQKEKLEKTQEALVRDQRILADTRQSLATVTNELNVTKLKLQVASQQKQENAVLVKSHVENEHILHKRGVSLQEDFATCISDTEALHRRVTVKDDLERRNLANVSTLKETVASGINSLGSILEQHKLQHETLVATSTTTLGHLGEALESGLKTISECVEVFSNDLLTQQDVSAKDDGVMVTRFQASCNEKFGSINSTIGSYSDVLRDQQERILEASKGISESFQDTQAAVSSIKAALKQFGSIQKNQFDSLTQDQENILVDLHERVLASLEQQTALLNDFKNFNENESELEVDNLRRMKTEIIENVTSSLDVLVNDTLNRVARRKGHVMRCSDEVLNKAEYMKDAMKNTQTFQSSRFETARRDIDTHLRSFEEDFSKHSDRESKNADQGLFLLGSLGDNVAKVCSSFQDASARTKEEVKETELLVTTLQTQRHEARNAQRQTCLSRIAEQREEMTGASTSLRKSAEQKQHELTSSLDSIQHTLHASQDKMKGAIASVQASVNGHEVLCDQDRNTVPERRTWPPFEELPRTRAHTEIISKMRKSKGWGDVPREDFGHLVLGNPEDGGTIADVPESPAIVASPQDGERIQEDGKANIVEERENLVESPTDHMSTSTSSSESSLCEEAQQPILCDTTNRRTRNRPKKKLEHVIKKKPSALPVPRTRSAVRRFGT